MVVTRVFLWKYVKCWAEPKRFFYSYFLNLWWVPKLIKKYFSCRQYLSSTVPGMNGLKSQVSNLLDPNFKWYPSVAVVIIQAQPTEKNDDCLNYLEPFVTTRPFWSFTFTDFVIRRLTNMGMEILFWGIWGALLILIFPILLLHCQYACICDWPSRYFVKEWLNSSNIVTFEKRKQLMLSISTS